MCRHGDHLGFRLPILDIFLDELHVEDGSGQISLEGQRADAEYHLDVRHFHRNVDMKRFC
jgi:hypothetical protein